jgi:hypothetical protein
MTRAQHDVGVTPLAITFEGITRDRCAEKQKVIEMRNPALRPGATDVVDAGRGGAADLGHRIVIERRRFARRCRRIVIGHVRPQ